jgi:hypothetical protein
VTCPHCTQAAPYHQDRERTLLSVVGPLRYRRAYYFCRRCGQGYCPFDQQAHLTGAQLTPGLEQLASLAGTVGESFGRGADVLHEMAGVRLSESTLERTTEAAGLRLAELWEREVTLGADRPWQWRRDAQGRTVAYVTSDATGTRQQGPGGAAAEGRMAQIVGVYNPPPEYTPVGQKRPALQARYLAGLCPVEQLGPPLRRQAAQVGMEQAEVWVALSDGASGLEQFLRGNFNRAELVVILDFYHPAGYLEKLAQALHPAEPERAQQQAEQWCSLLKAEGGAVTLAVLREWDWPARQSQTLREQLETVEGYFAKNVHRMEYPEYQAEGWQIGSGVVESACQTVVGQRLKGAGMRWSESGAHALCQLRALYRSEPGQWEAFWQRRVNQKTPVQQLN